MANLLSKKLGGNGIDIESEPKVGTKISFVITDMSQETDYTPDSCKLKMDTILELEKENSAIYQMSHESELMKKYKAFFAVESRA